METGLKNYTYTYNGFGQRVARNYTYSKLISPDQTVVSGELTVSSKQYFYDHLGRLIAEEGSKTYRGEGTTTEKIVYLYDESAIIGMEYTVGSTTSTYYFHRNLLGDVIGIYDTSGTLVAKYLYDAWGNCTISSETTNDALAHANPIRYRGYYYDDDTGLYYLSARYYSPKWRRFISPDDTAYLDPAHVNGLNLYCYCNNDPVNFVDPSGHSITAVLIAAAIGAIIGAASYTAGQLIEYAVTGTFEWSWGGFVGATIGGAIGGALAYALGGLALTSKVVAYGVKWVGPFASGFIANTCTMVGENITGDAHYSPAEICLDSAISGVFSLASAGFTKKVRFTNLNRGRGSFKAVSDQIYTKFRRDLIKRASLKTLGKMATYEAYSDAFGTTLDSLYESFGLRKWALSFV